VLASFLVALFCLVWGSWFTIVARPVVGAQPADNRSSYVPAFVPAVAPSRQFPVGFPGILSDATGRVSGWGDRPRKKFLKISIALVFLFLFYSCSSSIPVSVPCAYSAFLFRRTVCPLASALEISSDTRLVLILRAIALLRGF
jgi:hypothetical protein